MHPSTTVEKAHTKAVTSKRGHRVNTQHVDQLISTYKKERWVGNTQKIGKPDALSTWYGLGELMNFISLAQENHADGIKMQFGVYPADYAEVPEYRGRQTVVLIATRKSKTEHGIVNKAIYLNKDGKSEILAFNAGQACPPFCGTGLPPDGDDWWYGLDMEKIGLSVIDGNDHILVI